MSKEQKWPITLKVDIEAKGLKRIVKEGRLMEFVQAFSMLASQHIKAQLVEQLAQAGVGLTKQAEAVKIVVGFDPDDPYGTPPKPWPWPPRGMLGLISEHQIREIVREELGQM